MIAAQQGALGGIDWAIVGAAVVILFVISYVFGRRERDTSV